MRNATLSLVAASWLVFSVGCQATQMGNKSGCSAGCCTSGCASGVGTHDGSGPLGLGIAGRLHGRPASPPGYVGRGSGLPADVMSGNATATVSYPYYTVRSPRDYFLDNPPSLGP